MGTTFLFISCCNVGRFVGALYIRKSSPESVNLCGNLVCEVEKGETADSCAMDCQCNLDGICDKWESISSCPLDCHCGNNICDKELGENADNCPSDCTKGCEEMEDKYDGDGISSSMDTMHHEGDVNVNIHEDGMHYSSSSDSEDMEGDSCKENGESCSDHSDCCSSA